MPINLHYLLSSPKFLLVINLVMVVFGTCIWKYFWCMSIFSWANFTKNGGLKSAKYPHRRLCVFSEAKRMRSKLCLRKYAQFADYTKRGGFVYSANSPLNSMLHHVTQFCLKTSLLEHFLNVVNCPPWV